MGLRTYGAMAALLGVMLVSAGCSVSRALNAPAEKNYGVLEPGTHRDLVRAELGPFKKSLSGADCDVFAFAEGSTDLRYLRIVGYSLAGIGTLGMSELITEPVEGAVGKDTVGVRVCYDTEQRVAYSERLQPGADGAIITGHPPQAH